jgi:hypothetical protein
LITSTTERLSSVRTMRTRGSTALATAPVVSVEPLSMTMTCSSKPGPAAAQIDWQQMPMKSARLYDVTMAASRFMEDVFPQVVAAPLRVRGGGSFA